MKHTIRKHALMLLNLYGVKEEEIKKSPAGLDVFVDLLSDELTKIKPSFERKLRSVKD